VTTENIGDTARFEANSDVLHEAIDGEVIIIDLATGTYYSLRDSAADVWGFVQRSPGIGTRELADALAHRYATNGADVESAVMRFMEDLLAEGLVRTSTRRTETTGADVAGMGSNGGPAAAFAPPVLERFTDMQDLVLLDPVHQVGESGWPHARPDVIPGRSSV
jgi:Coenzyme PQQ synthesis protein D (PqqD)